MRFGSRFLRKLLVLLSSGLAAAVLGAPLNWVQPAQAMSQPGFSKICYVPNRNTGVVEAAVEQNVFLPNTPFWGYTSPLPNGQFLIQYNLAHMNGPDSTPNITMFIFYHECAHAQFRTSDEREADCQALAAMSRDMPVTPQMMAEFSIPYARVGRQFPTGGPC